MVVRFVQRLELQSEIEFVGGFCQTNGQTLAAVIRDRLRRRGSLGIAVLLVEALRAGAELLTNPRAEMALRKARARIANRMHAVPDLHAKPVLEQVRSLDPDLGLIYGSPLLKPQLFGIPRFGTAGIHHGKMPQYRGKKTTFWSMYNGEETAGVTIQLVDAGIDTGQVIHRGEVAIGRKSISQVRKELEDLGFTLYLQAILDLKQGVERLVPEQGPKGRLYKDPQLADFVKFWWRQLRRRRHVASS